jgi:hypothetical protein
MAGDGTDPEINGTYDPYVLAGSPDFKDLTISGTGSTRTLTVTFDVLPQWGPHSATYDGAILACESGSSWNGSTSQYFQASLVDLPEPPLTFEKMIEAVFITYVDELDRVDGDPETTGVWGATSGDPPQPKP